MPGSAPAGADHRDRLAQLRVSMCLDCLIGDQRHPTSTTNNDVNSAASLRPAIFLSRRNSVELQKHSSKNADDSVHRTNHDTDKHWGPYLGGTNEVEEGGAEHLHRSSVFQFDPNLDANSTIRTLPGLARHAWIWQRRCWSPIRASACK